MWDNVGMIAGVVAMFGTGFKIHQSRLNKLDNSKVEKELFEERTGNIMRMLDRIDRRVEQLAKNGGID